MPFYANQAQKDEINSIVNLERGHFNELQRAMAGRPMLIGNASAIPRDAWMRIDTKSADVARDTLVLFGRLAAASTTAIGIGDLVSYYNQTSDSGEVNVSMDGRSEGKGDKVLTRYVGTPVPILDSYTARYGWREMAVMAKGGGMFDQKSIANNQRRLAEKLEDMALNGDAKINVGGNTIYGLRNFPQRTTNTHGLTLATATGAQWLAAFKDGAAKLIGDKNYGRVTVFANFSDWFAAENTDFAANYPKTIAQRLLEMGQILEVVPVPRLPANELIFIADFAQGSWGSILSAMPIVTRPKARHNPEDDYVFGTMAAAAPQFTADYDGKSAIAHLTQA